MAAEIGISRPTLQRSVLIALGVVALYFVNEGVLQYFRWSEAAYGYYWPYRLPLITHVTGGLIALLAGVWQLWSGFNGRAMGAHPWSGRLYVFGVVVGSFGAVALAVTSAVFGFAWGVALICLAAAWLATTGMALYCVRRRNLRLHKQWMVRSYIVTFAFVTFRLVVDHVPYEVWWGISQPDMSNAMIWPAWVIPLLVYEIALQVRGA